MAERLGQHECLVHGISDHGRHRRRFGQFGVIAHVLLAIGQGELLTRIIAAQYIGNDPFERAAVASTHAADFREGGQIDLILRRRAKGLGQDRGVALGNEVMDHLGLVPRAQRPQVMNGFGEARQHRPDLFQRCGITTGQHVETAQYRVLGGTVDRRIKVMATTLDHLRGKFSGTIGVPRAAVDHDLPRTQAGQHTVVAGKRLAHLGAAR
ncbi:hypothetical protein D9M68_809690 [compost metagenome]